ncbi:hypothetical protein [Aurantimonas manganoxydans]|uniref:hypothetical protein n=1 Tax=Aurantimonas manganoxydans TaxID=651183 RepID=UPI00031C1CAD|nr:hypothetical protein [Aurantimonas manganoxydans]
MSNIDPDRARQGEKGTPVLMILVAGLALCAVVFAGLGIYAWTMPDADVAVEGEAIEKPAEAPTTDGSGLATPQDSDTAAPESETAQ